MIWSSQQNLLTKLSMPPSRQETLIVLCIDVEPDLRELNLHNANEWAGFEKSVQFFSELRPRLEDATGKCVRFSWFLRMDPQINLAFGSPKFVTTRYRRLIESLRAAGDELGLHVHAWRWVANPEGWVTDLADQTWIDHCVRSSFEAFEEAMGHSCKSVRFGDRWMNNETVNLFRKLGARFELSMEPGTKGGTDMLDGRFTGSFPDLLNVPRRPYQPCQNDFRKEASRASDDFYILPLSSATLGRPPQQSVLAASSCHTKSDLVFEGCHDRTNCNVISGWAWCKSQPDDPINVDIYDGQNLFATVTANMFRPDLVKAGKGDGYHAFEFPVLNTLKDGKRHAIHIRISDTSLNLNSTPRTFKCDPVVDPSVEYFTLNVSYNSAVFCQALDQILDAGRTDYLAMVVRSDAAIQRPQRSNLGASLAYLAKHPLVDQFVFDTPEGTVNRLHGVPRERDTYENALT